MIVDASVLIAAANDRDPDATRCRQLLQSAHGVLLVPAPALAEAAYLIQKRLGVIAEIRLIHSLLDSPWKVVAPDRDDLQRTAQLMTQYADLPLGFSDACSIALAERHLDEKVASLDNHFRIVRPAHCASFHVLP